MTPTGPDPLEQARRRIAELEHEVALLRRSTSWRITAPLRAVLSARSRRPVHDAPPQPATPTGDTDRDLVMRFESLGDNCEFGLMQRKVGHERLGLLRYGGARNTERLIRAIDADLSGFGTEQDLDMYRLGDEWIALSLRYGFSFHTDRPVGPEHPRDVRAAESVKLRFMADLLREDLETGHKIFVRRVDEGDLTAGMAELAQALRRKGPAILLWVLRATGAKPHGTIEHLGRNLFLAHHGDLGLYGTATVFNEVLWIDLLRRAEAAIDAHRSRTARRLGARLARRSRALILPTAVDPGSSG